MPNHCQVIVLGGAGMLGHKMFQVLRNRIEGVVCTTRENTREAPYGQVELLQGGDVFRGVDVTNFENLGALLRGQRPRFIVNCVGIIKQRAEAESPTPSILINSLLPHVLCDMASEWGGRVIHFSTDCVFSGKRGAYSEQDPSDAEDLYGRSKFLGETTESNGLTLRTSIIGRELSEHRSLLDWFLSRNGQRVRGFCNAIYSGVTTNHLAETVAWIIEHRPDLSGLYQVTSEPISKHDLLHLVREAYQLNVEIEPDNTEVCDRSMVGAKFQSATGLITPDWPELVRRLAADPTPYERWLS